MKKIEFYQTTIVIPMKNKDNNAIMNDTNNVTFLVQKFIQRQVDDYNNSNIILLTTIILYHNYYYSSK